MNNFKFIVLTVFFTISFSQIGCSRNRQTTGTPALFETQLEAEKAAKDFNCTGAHKMGEKWMPCKNHVSHKETKHEVQSENHNHHH